MRRTLLEAFLVGLVGALLAFAANALSPRGLKLTRNFYPHDHERAMPGSTNTLAGAGATNGPSFQQVADRLRQAGLQVALSNQVAQLFHDPGYGQNLVMFIDSRDDQHYRSGHIPGAFQLDYYRKENYLDGVLPGCQVAQQILVYCYGGNCEDSELTATLLRDAGVPKEKLLVYIGGFTEWTNNRMPVEIGERNSGLIEKRD